MTPGWLSLAGRDLKAAWSQTLNDIAAVGERFLDALAGGPAVSEELADMAPWECSPGRIVPLAAEVQALDADVLHHGCWTLHYCAVNNTVTVVPLSGFTCPICDSSPADSPAGDRPAAVSDGIPTTAPAAGHPNPLRDMADADTRIGKRLSRLCQLDRLKRS